MVVFTVSRHSCDSRANYSFLSTMAALIGLIFVWSLATATIVNAKPASQTYVLPNAMPVAPAAASTASLVETIPASPYNVGYTFYDPAALVAAAPLVYTYPSPVAIGRSLTPAVNSIDKMEPKIVVTDTSVNLNPKPNLNPNVNLNTSSAGLNLGSTTQLQNENLVLENSKPLASNEHAIVLERKVENDEDIPIKLFEGQKDSIPVLRNSDLLLENVNLADKKSVDKHVDGIAADSATNIKMESIDSLRQKRHIAAVYPTFVSRLDRAQWVPQTVLAPSFLTTKNRVYPYTQLDPLAYSYSSPYFAYLK